MSEVLVRKAFEKRLLAMTPALKIAGENSKYEPVPNSPHQEVALLPAAPENPSMGDGYYRLIGVVQVLLNYPINIGTADIAARAQAIRSAFARGLRLQQDSANILIRRTPVVGPGMLRGDRWCVPVSIDYSLEVFD